MKIVVLDGFIPRHGGISWQLDEMFDVTWHDATSADQICARIGDAEAAFVNRLPLTAEVFSTCRNLRFVGTFGTGLNHIDIVAARQAGVSVCNVPDYSSAAVAQHTMALLLAIACQIGAYDRYIKDGSWHSLTDPLLVNRGMFELQGRTLGLVGFGGIAKGVARAAQAFGMRVIACRRSQAQDTEMQAANVTHVSLDELLMQSDIVSLHCPLNDETQGMVDRAFIAKMCDGAALLNTARGALLNDADVVTALENGKLFMLGTDVFAHEPITGAEAPLAKHPRVVATPHIAWTAVQTRQRLLDVSAQNLLCFLEGKPQNLVN